MGNPHVVLYCQRRGCRAAGVGRARSWKRMPIFPRRINVHFVQVHDRRRSHDAHLGARQRHHAGLRHRRVGRVRGRRLTGRTDRKILAHLPGGDLELEWAARQSRLHDRPGHRSFFRRVAVSSA